ncbi:MAG: hemerythrin domain-containing protein [Ferruginibacter sp.]
MKRHEAIAPLSRDHHASLILAQLLKKNAPAYKGLPETPADKATYAQELFQKSIQRHFEQEEAMLDLVTDGDAELIAITKEIKTEHKELTVLFHSLKTANDLTGTLDTLGVALEKHIRKEERILFPLLQLHCSDEQFQQIYKLLH